jgi:hypothetical protein
VSWCLGGENILLDSFYIAYPNPPHSGRGLPHLPFPSNPLWTNSKRPEAQDQKKIISNFIAPLGKAVLNRNTSVKMKKILSDC